MAIRPLPLIHGGRKHRLERCRVTGGAPNIPTGATTTITWTTEQWDTGDFFDLAGAPTILQAGPAGTLYLLQGRLTWAAGAGTRRHIAIWNAGAALAAIDAPPIAGIAFGQTIHYAWRTIADDEQFRLRVLHDVGADLGLLSVSFDIQALSD